MTTEILCRLLSFVGVLFILSEIFNWEPHIERAINRLLHRIGRAERRMEHQGAGRDAYWYAFFMSLILGWVLFVTLIDFSQEISIALGLPHKPGPGFDSDNMALELAGQGALLLVLVVWFSIVLLYAVAPLLRSLGRSRKGIVFSLSAALSLTTFVLSFVPTS